ncbi:SRPBCC family protein [soil metagenome]
MSHNSRELRADIEHVWDVLSDGWLYPLWVVGASRMREVDASWPAVGAHLHHSVGSWPLLLDDTTEVIECVPGRRLVLTARAWPSGEAEVILDLRRSGIGRTVVDIREQAVRGPGRLVPHLLQDPPLAWRNVESLRRLAFVAENRA